MASWLAKLVPACWRPNGFGRNAQIMNQLDTGGQDEELMWYKDLLQHSCGDISMAVIQANASLEDQSQVEIGPSRTFVGVYDGHGGPEAAEYVCSHLFSHFQRFVNDGAIPEDAIRKAFQATEEGFSDLVRRSRPGLLAVGTCCLVGVIWGRALYIANLGDSRAVLGRLSGVNCNIVATQLTADDNANSKRVRRQMKALHPDDAQIVVKKHGVWRVKGIIQVSKAIGDFSLKLPPLRRPVISANPTVNVRCFQQQDQFLIFASDGFWEHLSNQAACELVYKNPRMGIAKRLVRAAVDKAVRKHRRRFTKLGIGGKGARRLVHDDITVIVVFIDHEKLGMQGSFQQASLRSGADA